MHFKNQYPPNYSHQRGLTIANRWLLSPRYNYSNHIIRCSSALLGFFLVPELRRQNDKHPLSDMYMNSSIDR